MIAKLTFLGAAGTVTGSRFLLETQGKKLLVDCGLFQGLKELRLKNREPFPVPPAGIDEVLITHAHIDHCGYLPQFVKQGFTGKVRCTCATADLCSIVLRDSAHLQEEDARWANKKGFSRHRPALPLYTIQDVEECLKHFEPVHYGEDIFLADGLRVKFKDAGHILGSSCIDIKITRGVEVRRFFFSGDLGGPDRPILCDPVQAFEVDYLILESTYGNRLHGHGNAARKDSFEKIITESIKRGGVLVIPSFAVERSQELLFYIRELEESRKIPVLPVYLDSPMAIEATKVFEKFKSSYDLQARLLELDGNNILKTGNLHLTKAPEESKQLHNVKGPAIIIAGSGMLEGGRILHHLEHRLPHPENTLLFVGYQAEGTRGRAILNGSTAIKIHGQEISVNAKIEIITGFSGHADYKEVLAWLMGFNRPPHKTFIVHGEPAASQAMADKIKERLGWEVFIPGYLESCKLN